MPTNDPTTGPELWRWARDCERDLEVGMTRYLRKLGHHLGYPARVVDWSPAEVAEAFGRATKALAKYLK